MTIKKQPQIRFGGFGGDWESEKLENLATFAKGQGFSKSDLVDKGNPIILYGRLYTNYQTEISNVDTFVNSSDGIKSFGNEVIVPASGETPEDIARASAVCQAGVILGGDLNIIYPKQITPTFLALNISNGKAKSEIVKRSQGKSVVHVRNNDLKEIEISFPQTPEQIAIGQFFRQLDEMLTLAEQKHAQTVQLKKAMLGKLFPISGSLQPQIRLKGFSGDWVERKFGDLADVQRGLTYSPNNICENGIRVLRSSNINEDTYLEHQNDVFIDKNAVNIPLVQDNDILITSANGSSRLVGKHAIIKLGNTPAVHGGFMLLARTNQPFFLNASMSSDWYSKFINTYVAGGNGAIGNLSRSDLVEQIILVPETIAEQTAIGKLFQTLDHTIALQAKEINQIKQLKSALLGKMFV